MRIASEFERKKGFTLIEVLLTVALIALLSGVFAMNIASLLRDGEIESVQNEYWRAVDMARAHSVFHQRPYFLEWEPETRSFVVVSSGETKRFAVDADHLGDTPIEALFEEIAPENSYVLIRGELVQRRTVARVGFYPDGTCTPYTVTLRVGELQSHFQMDPWTGARLADPDEQAL